MNREDIQKLVGGYATGTLTPQEQQALFEAALHDQDLFDALAREQALRDLLRDPVAKARLLAELDRPPSRWRQLAEWLRRPAAVGAVMTVAAVIAFFVVRQNMKPPPVVTVAEVHAPPASPEAAAPRPSAPAAEVKAPVRDELALARPALREKERPQDQAKRAEARPFTKPAPPAVPAQPLVLPPVPAPQNQALLAQQLGAVPPQQNQQAQALQLQAQKLEVIAGAPAADAITLFYGGAAASQFAANEFLDTGADALPAKKDAGVQAEQKEKTVQARQPAARPGLAGFAPAADSALKKVSPANLGVQYRILRALESGEYADVVPGESIEAGTALKLQIEPNNGGYLVVTESGPGDIVREVANRRVEGWSLVETLLPVKEPGRKELRVWFSRQPQAGLAGSGAPPGGNLVQMTADTKSGAGAVNRQRWTYVVSRSTDPISLVVFTITLNYK